MSKEQLETASSVSPVAWPRRPAGSTIRRKLLRRSWCLGTAKRKRFQAMEGMDAAQMEAEEIIRQCLKNWSNSKGGCRFEH